MKNMDKNHKKPINEGKNMRNCFLYNSKSTTLPLRILAHWSGSLKTGLSQRAKTGSKTGSTPPLKGGEPLSQWPAFFLAHFLERDINASATFC